MKGNVDEKRFAPSVRQALADPNDRLLAHLKTIGAIQKFELIERADTGTGILYTYKLAFESMTLSVEIGVGKDGKIAVFDLHPE